AAFYGTNGDVSLPTARGFAPGAGSILAALAAATGRAPIVMGKPEPHMYQSAIERLGTAPERTVMIGDRLDTDILGAQRFGMQAVLLLTGVETEASAEAGEMASGTVFTGLPDLMLAWSQATQVA